MPTLLENLKPHLEKLSLEEKRALIVHFDKQVNEKLDLDLSGPLAEEMREGLAELYEARQYIQAIVTAADEAA